MKLVAWEFATEEQRMSAAQAVAGAVDDMSDFFKHTMTLIGFCYSAVSFNNTRRRAADATSKKERENTLSDLDRHCFVRNEMAIKTCESEVLVHQRNLIERVRKAFLDNGIDARDANDLYRTCFKVLELWFTVELTD